MSESFQKCNICPPHSCGPKQPEVQPFQGLPGILSLHFAKVNRRHRPRRVYLALGISLSHRQVSDSSCFEHFGRERVIADFWMHLAVGWSKFSLQYFLFHCCQRKHSLVLEWERHRTKIPIIFSSFFFHPDKATAGCECSLSLFLPCEVSPGVATLLSLSLCSWCQWHWLYWALLQEAFPQMYVILKSDL